jgi:hypothetical protein
MFGLGPYFYGTSGLQGYFGNEFFKNAAFGFKYATDYMGVSVQVGLADMDAMDVDSDVAFDLHIAGFYQVMPALKIEADFLGTNLTDEAPTANAQPYFANKPLANNMGFGLKAIYDEAPLTAEATFVFIKDGSASNADTGFFDSAWTWLQLKGDYQISSELSAGATITLYPLFHEDADLTDMSLELRGSYIAAPIDFNITITFENMLIADGDALFLTIEPSFGYQINEDIKAGIDLSWGIGLGKAVEKMMAIVLRPYVDVTVAEGATMYFGWELAHTLDDGSGESGTNWSNLLLGFKWSF